MVLLPSPLLGPVVWMPVAELLRGSGLLVDVARLPGPVRHPDEVLAGFLEAVPAHRDVVLVPHSNAGLYVAGLAAGRRVSGVVFVDALLPGPSESTPVAPAGLRVHLASLAGADGLLPPWTQWWSDEDVAGLFPDAATRAAFEPEQPRLPASYFHAEVRTPAGWESIPAAYVGFGSTYAEEQAEAERRGWPVATMAGQHLHMLVDPAAVAQTIARLAPGPPS